MPRRRFSQAWYVGQEGGTALGEVLFGNVNPSGRLPCTFDLAFEDNPAFANYPGQNRPRFGPARRALFRRHFRRLSRLRQKPQRPAVSVWLRPELYDVRLRKHEAQKRPMVFVCRWMLPTPAMSRGPRWCKFMLGSKNARVSSGRCELKGFAKVMLQPGQTQNVEVLLPRDSFSFWSPATKRLDHSSLEPSRSKRGLQLAGYQMHGWHRDRLNIFGSFVKFEIAGGNPAGFPGL